MASDPEPEVERVPVFHDLAHCDLCGALLPRSDRVSGLCLTCRKPPAPSNRQRVFPRRKAPISRAPRPGGSPSEPGPGA